MASPAQPLFEYVEEEGAATPLPHGPSTKSAEFCVVIPTFNECGNLPVLVDAIRCALGELAWEIIIVDDDSPDGTARCARNMHLADPRVRVIQRVGRRGLASACIEGMLATSAPFVAVMDGDLQHDPAVLSRMWRALRLNRADVVVASRYVEGGSVGAWDGERAAASRFATWLTNKVTPTQLTDPMSGFFAVRREVIDERVHDLSGIGFKILLDIVLTDSRGLRIVETPYAFGPRADGNSKFSLRSAVDFGLLLVDKAVGRRIPVRFLAFGAVGASGVVLHFLILSVLLQVAGVPFTLAQASATLMAIVANYTVNNALTYRDRMRRGWRWLTGLGSFAAVCGVGALGNIGIASLLFNEGAQWSLAALAGIAAGAVWNYAVTARYTWPGRS